MFMYAYRYIVINLYVRIEGDMDLYHDKHFMISYHNQDDVDIIIIHSCYDHTYYNHYIIIYLSYQFLT